MEDSWQSQNLDVKKRFKQNLIESSLSRTIF